MKHRMYARALSLFLAFVMCIGMLPGAALAQGANPVVPPDVSSDTSEETITPDEPASLPEGPVADGDTSEEAETSEVQVTPPELNDGMLEEASIAPMGISSGDWKMQIFGGNTDLEIPEGAIISEPESIGFTADYSKIYGSASAPNGNVTIYYAPTEETKYADSVLEFTFNMLGEESGRFRFAVFPRFVNGKSCDGIAIDTPAGLQHSYWDGWPGCDNLLGKTFATATDYKVKLITVGNKITMYLDEGTGYQKLTETGTYSSPAAGTNTTFGFRVWGPAECKDLKKLQIKDATFTAYVPSTVGKVGETIDEADWGESDVVIPITLGNGDTVASVKNGNIRLESETDYTVTSTAITLSRDYIKAQENGFALTITFAGGDQGTFNLTKKIGPFVYVEDFARENVDNWVKKSGDGAVTLENGALHIEGDTLVVDTTSPITQNGEAEFLIETLTDNGKFGLVFRAGEDGSWQSFYNDESSRYQYATGFWNYRNNGGANDQVLADGTPVLRRPAGVDYTMKVRFVGQTLTVWMDGNPIYSADLGKMGLGAGHIGIQTGGGAEILLKKVTYRSYNGLTVGESAGEPKIISKGGLDVALAADFPNILSYAMNGKRLDGCVVPKHYVSINGTDYPATAQVTAETEESVTYAVTVDMDEEKTATFDVTFSVGDNQIIDMSLSNIDESSSGVIYTLNFPEQPLISAKKTQSGFFDAAVRGGNDLNKNLADATLSKTAVTYAQIPIISANGLSASMYNNVYNNRMEFSAQSFDLAEDDVTTGVWNTDFYYRGLDGELMLPQDEDPGCQIVITGDTNADNKVDWQDGANALKKITNGKIVGADKVRNSMIHVGYNFVSEAQQPFLKVADNVKRLGNLIDGFDQIAVLKGYANEGHDSGHADYADINKRAGGVEDLKAMSKAISDAGLGTFGVHINHSEAYPEAKMFTDETMSTKNGWKWMDQSKYIRREVDIMSGGLKQRLDDMLNIEPGIGFVYVDTYRDDRFAAAKLAQNITGDHDAVLGTEEGGKLDRWTAWVHHNEGANYGTIHRFVYSTQKDVYQGNGNFWGGYNNGTSFMSWQHKNNITPFVAAFYTNQLPQKYLMNHEVLRLDGSDAYFEGGVRTNNYQMWKTDNGKEKLMVGNGGYFIPWYDESSETKNPDDADKIYYWATGVDTKEWSLPNAEWAALENVKLYQNTQTGRVFVEDVPVVGGKITLTVSANTPYVIYPGDPGPSVTDWSTGSPIKDTSFNSRDFSIWEKDGESDIKFTDDGNGVSILTMEGIEAGAVSQTMTGLVPGQKYRALVWAGAENGKTARITVDTPDGVTYMNYVDQIVRGNNCFDTYASNKRVERVWVDFIQPEGENTATITLSADACEAAEGKATFMESRIVKTVDPGLPIDDPLKNFVAYETFEYIEQGGTGIFTPEGGGDGGYHLSETHGKYTTDTIPTGVDGAESKFSLKMSGYGRANMRTYPATMRLMPGVNYTVEFDTLGNGTVEVVSESTGSDKPLRQSFSQGHTKLAFTTGGKNDYIIRIEGCDVLDNFQVYYVKDMTPPTTPANLTAVPVENSNAVALTWEAATDDDSGVNAYRIYRGDTLLTTVGKVTTYTDSTTAEETAYTYHVSAINGGATESEKSEAANVTSGILKPVATGAELIGMGSVTVTFNKAMDRESAESIENYSLTGEGVSISDAVLSQNGKSVVLTLEGMGATDVITLTVKNVMDASGKGTIAEQVFPVSALIRYLKLEETEGAVAKDEMNKGNGTRSDNVKSVAGKDGKAAGFDGDSYIDLAPDTLRGQNEYSISLWINWNGNTSESNTILSNNTSGDPNATGTWLRINGGGIITADNINGGGVASSKGAAANTWNHVALIRKSDRTELYLNGEKVIDTDHTIALGNSRIRIGGNFNGSGGLLHKFRGGIDEFKIFGVALSTADILKLAGKALAPTPEATFDAATGLLSNVTAGMVYSVDGGTTWLPISETEVQLAETNLTTENGICVKQLGDDADIFDSEIQVIVLTRAEKPTGLAKTDETSARNDGTITGVTTAMEYSANGNDWTACPTDAVVGLAPGDYQVRIKASGTVLTGENITITITAYVPSSGGGSSNTTTKTEKNEDGSTTKTVTNKKTGAVTATTTYPDGSEIVTTTPKDGKTSIEVTVPKDKEKVTVTIPTDKQPAPDEVAVIIREDGTREIIKTSMSTKDGLRVTLTGNAKLEIVDNSKSFADMGESNWAYDAVQFAASRELFQGTGGDSFSPAGDMTRSMLITVLARLDGQDTAGGETWYSKAMDWGKENGITDGTNADASITRESLVVMLYRYAKVEKTDGMALEEFSDTDEVSGWASEAMNWAVANGILNGSGGKLNPTATATRAEVAAMLMRFVSAVQ